VNPTLEELRCDDCAFRSGTDASTCERTVLLAQLCVESLEKFNCHRREGLCAGWAQGVNALGSDWYKAQPEWKQTLRRELIELIHRSASEKIDLNVEMGKIFDRIEGLR
jgi:hypothetical protein